MYNLFNLLIFCKIELSPALCKLFTEYSETHISGKLSAIVIVDGISFFLIKNTIPCGNYIVCDDRRSSPIPRRPSIGCL